MDLLIKKFIDNNCVHNEEWDGELEEKLLKKQSENDYLTYLLIIGNKALKDGNKEVAQYISSILYRKAKDGNVILSREHYEFLEKVENINMEQYKNEKFNLIISSAIITFIIFMILLFIFDVKLKNGVIFLVLMTLLDIYLVNKNMNNIFYIFTKNKIIKKVDKKIIDFVNLHEKI